MALAQLSVDLVAKVATFERDLKRGADAAVANSNRMAKALDVAKAGVAGLAASLSAGVLVGFARDAIDAFDALNDVSDATGSTIENISALQDLARRSKTEIDTVTTALIKFNGVLAEADPTKGPGAILKALNLDLAALKRQDPAEAMRQVAVAFQNIGNEGDRARVVQALFGKSVKEVAPYLKDLAEAGQLNATVTTEQAAQAEKFNKELARLQTNASNAARAIVGSLLPALNKVFDDVRTLGDKASLAGLASDVTGLAGKLKQLQSIKVNAVFVPADIDRQIADVTAQLEAAKKKFNAALGPSPRDALRSMDRNLPWKDIVLPQDSEGGGGGRAGRSKPSGSSAPVVRPDLELDAISAEFDALYKQAQERSDRARQIYEGLLTPVESLARKEAELERLRKDGLISEETYARARLSYAQEYDEAMAKGADTLSKNNEVMDELTRSAIQASENIQNALGTTLKDVLKGDFDDIGDAFSDLLLDMAAEAAAANIMDAFFGKANSQGKRSGAGILGDLGGLLDFLPSFDGGGFTGTGARSGGIDGKGGFLSVLHPSETVTDHTRGGSVGGGQTIVVHQNFTVGDVASISMVRQAVAGSEARIAAQFSRSQKYGGAAS